MRVVQAGFVFLAPLLIVGFNNMGQVDKSMLVPPKRVISEKKLQQKLEAQKEQELSQQQVSEVSKAEK